FVAVCSLAACGGSAAPSTAAVGSSAPPVAGSQSPGPKTSAASPAASTAAQLSPRADWQAEWDRLVAAAKQEGQVNVATTSGSAPAVIFEGFKAKYGITVNVLGQTAGALLPKIQTERAAGQFTQDVSLNATNT